MMTSPTPGKATYRDDLGVRVPHGGKKVYEGDAPIDPASGNYHLLEIWAGESPEGFTIYVSDDGRGWVDDLSKIFWIEAAELMKLRVALRATADDDLVEVFAKRITDKAIKVPGRSDHYMDIVDFPSDWLETNGINYSWAQEISEA